MAIQSTATEQGLHILLDNIKDQVKKYVIVGDIDHTNAKLDEVVRNYNAVFSDIKDYIVHEGVPETASYDGTGVLTFKLPLPYDANFDKYTYGIALIANKDGEEVIVSIAPMPKIAKVNGVGGLFTYKVAVRGEPGEIIYDYTDLEFVEDEDLFNLPRKQAVDAYQVQQMLNTQPSSGFKNFIINGDFRVWQRGEGWGSIIVTDYSHIYTADRWCMYHEGGFNAAVYKEEEGIKIEAQSDVNFVTILEDLHSLSGKALTLSFYIKADAPSNITVHNQQFIAPTVEWYRDDPVSVTTSWQRVEITINTKTLERTVIDAATLAYYYIRFELPVGTYYLSNVQLEISHCATTFEIRPRYIEEQLCKRYYERLGGKDCTVFGMSFTDTAQRAGVVIQYQPKRIIPNLRFSGAFMLRQGPRVDKVKDLNIWGQKTNEMYEISAILEEAVGQIGMAGFLCTHLAAQDVKEIGVIEISAEIYEAL